MAALEEEIPRLEARAARRKTWRFGGEDAAYLAWKREVYAELVAGLRELADEETGALGQLAARERRSRELVRKTLEEAAPAWEACRARILVNERYRGLSLSPQEGLIPLGPDPDSGLEEFLHWAMHEAAHPIPSRDAEGKLPPMDGETGAILVLFPGVCS